jgi:hypothetical protein
VKNAELQKQVEAYKRDIEIHKDVEKELAKRSQLSQEVIKKLRQDLNGNQKSA